VAETTTDTAATRAAGVWRRLAPWRWRALRLPFVLVYVVGLSSEVLVFWRLDPATVPLLAGAFTGFGLLGSLAFGFVRALPPDAAVEARVALAAGRRATHAAVLSLVALLVLHGWSEGWPGMQLLGAWRPTELLVRALVVLLVVGAASAGLVAIWRLDELLARPDDPAV
jgi:hypothetical protein